MQLGNRSEKRLHVTTSNCQVCDQLSDNTVKLYWIKVFVQHVAKFLEYMAEIDCAHIVIIYIILIGKGHKSLKKMINAERALGITRHW